MPHSRQRLYTMKRVPNPWELGYDFQKAFEAEDYETCATIKRQVEHLIATGQLDEQLMQGFRSWNPQTQRFEGEPTHRFNGLYDAYWQQHPC
ncbi:hypothetical protein [Larkinella soli]|uniref:hypothetical protein n=1 Tax=Larkinella soli TaxID=1770527 RepID=UPI000FFB6D8D|nr:hypothetical protein [Larkinella soli]